MKIISLVGARPQFIKEAVLHKALAKAGINEILVNSGQHYDYNMSNVFVETLGITEPHYNLGVGSGTHGEVTGRTIMAFEAVAVKEEPDLILVYGDTNATLAGSLVSSKLKIPLAHVEAGIRMLPKDMPEEINRTVTDRLATLLFCSSERGKENLAREGITEGVVVTGDVSYDLFLQLKPRFSFDLLGELDLVEDRFALVTLHRDYNVDSAENLTSILQNLATLAREIPLVFPLHPRTKARIEGFGLTALLNGIKVLGPVSYLDMMGLTAKSNFVITDSGGLQKEAYFAGKSAVLIMVDPAWHELVEQGGNFLVQPAALSEGNTVLEDLVRTRVLGAAPSPVGIYGRGDAGEKIVQEILNWRRKVTIR
jgi:UDP-N-acetylglucosamine 2-epimerase (non-hydrolysing)